MSLLTEVCLSFLKIGAFSFGGGYAVLALLQREVVEGRGWIDPDGFVNMVAIAEMTPGPVAVNASTFVGYHLFGLWGGVLCTACTLLIPFLLTLMISICFQRFQNNPTLKNALSGIRPAVIGLIASACVSVGKISLVDGYSLIFFGIALFMVWRCKVNPILTLAACGVMGAVFYGYVLPLL